MPEILSQKEIDVLLAAGDAAPPAATEVTPWDFAAVPRVPRDRQAVLEAAFAAHAQRLESLLATTLRAPVAVAVAGVEAVEAHELLLSLASPCAAATFEAGPAGSRATGVLDLGVDLAFRLLDRLFGGSGREPAPRRPLTAIERAALRPVAERALALLAEAWQGRVRLEGILAIESDPAGLRLEGAEEGVIAASYEVRLGAEPATLVVGVPAAVLEAGLRDPLREARGPRPERPRVEAALRTARLALTARLPRIQVRMRDVTALAPGQVLHTGLAADTPVELFVNGGPGFTGALGQVQGHVGLRIVQRTTTPAAARPVCPKKGRVL